MNATLLDHLFALLLILPLPLFGAWQLRRLKACLAAGERDVRIRVYRGVMLEEVVLVGAVLAIWAAHGRPWGALAPAPPESAIWIWVGWVATAVISLLLILQAALAAGLDLGPAVSVAAAVLGSSAMFGLAHAYQGPSGMVRTGAVGLVLAALAVATGGLLAPMIVHSVMDVTSGFLAQRALGTASGAGPEPALAR